ncbi:MAG: hypothetical protein M3550_02690 [Actinomycetota bacterium]|nr:hypothetical protein [Actinomycetota bacterium]
MGREHEIKIRLSEGELAQLDELRPPGMPRAVFLRSLVHKPPDVADVASAEEALAILTAMARDGRVTAAIALARELSGQHTGAREGDPLAEVDRIYRMKVNGGDG